MQFHQFSRRNFLSTVATVAAGSAAFPLRGVLSAADDLPRPHILLRPGTHQGGNIGDIAHSPGALKLFQNHFPEARFTVWPVGISETSRSNLLKMFPEVNLVEGNIDRQGKASTPQLQQAWDTADLLLHGSSPGFKGQSYMPAWKATSDKPYGIFGMTHDPLSGVTGDFPDGAPLATFRKAIERLPENHMRQTTKELLDGAAFIYCRDTLTQRYLEQQKVKSPLIAFGPDATFALRIRDDESADRYLKEKGLQEGRFLCVIPRLRYTPYHRLQGREPSKADLLKDQVNEKTVARDHEEMRGVITRWVRETGLPVLACPEMSYQIELAREQLVDPLEEDVKSHVVWRDTYWQPDEAASVYARSTAVMSFECHSPIISLTNGTPAIYLRQPTDTIKGQMYHDIGVSDWTFEAGETNRDDWYRAIETIASDPAAARRRVEKVMAGINAIQRNMVMTARSTVTSPRR
ncbi:MAG TPA: polysaccharide pyruvyl transferase family protein [Planctomicrobium sp.]|nr:polysaccharide pyruvyl transferase family protein [Planctomicrobium sp.]